MNKRIFITGTLIVVLSLLVGLSGSVGANGPTVEDSIEAGLTWLAGQQNPDGSWEGWCQVAHTGLAVLKFETYATENGLDPLDEGYVYYDQVFYGLEYIMGKAITVGDLTSFDDCGRPTYGTGIAMMALAASTHQELYGDTLQEALNWMVDAQNDPDCGLHRGGWGYDANQCGHSDNSNAGYATLGLGFAQAPPPYGFGLTVPDATKDELGTWIGVMQDPVDGDIDDGGSYYTPGGGWVNTLKTGNLIYEMGLTGDTKEAVRVQNAVAYIERHWSDPGLCSTGWQNEYQAMFTMMKGFESLGIDLIELDGNPPPEHDWFAEVSQHIVDTQLLDGSWPSDCWGDSVLTTAWALLTLEKTVPVFDIPVPFDVHPGSCPNPLNVDKKGVTPAAIAGTVDFDVTKVDPESILLKFEDDDAGVAPLRWAYEDVTIPYDLDYETFDRDSCIWDFEVDKITDLTLKFATQEIAEMYDGVGDGDELLLHLTGNLFEEFGGAPIVGADVVWIIEK